VEHPTDFDVEDIARIVGVGADFEFATEDSLGQHFHFPGEVLYVEPGEEFPWKLLDAWEWAAEKEADNFRRGGWE
jgi:hypothetical protein